MKNFSIDPSGDDFSYYEKQHFKKIDKLLKRLQKRLKSKIVQAINLVFDEDVVYEVEVCKKHEVEGNKVRASEWFEQSVALRYLYENIVTCSYTETYGGDIFLPIENNEYLRVRITG